MAQILRAAATAQAAQLAPPSYSPSAPELYTQLTSLVRTAPRQRSDDVRDFLLVETRTSGAPHRISTVAHFRSGCCTRCGRQDTADSERAAADWCGHGHRPPNPRNSCNSGPAAGGTRKCFSRVPTSTWDDGRDLWLEETGRSGSSRAGSDSSVPRLRPPVAASGDRRSKSGTVEVRACTRFGGLLGLTVAAPPRERDASP
jgi:hypothetical protein